MIGGGLMVLFCLCVLVIAKPVADKRAKEEITFGNQQNGKVKRADISVQSTEDHQGSVEAQDAHALDGEESQDSDAKDQAKAEEVVKLLTAASPTQTLPDNIEIVSSDESQSLEPSESEMMHEGDDEVSSDEGDDLTGAEKDDVELDTTEDDDDEDETSDTAGDEISITDEENENDGGDEGIKNVHNGNQLTDTPTAEGSIGPELLKNYYDNYLRKLYYKSKTYPYLMRYLYRRRRAALPHLKASKRNKRIKRDLYYPSFSDLELARRLLKANGMYYSDEDLSTDDDDVENFNQPYGMDVSQLSTWDGDFERPEDEEYGPYNYPYDVVPYQDESTYTFENKRDFPQLEMLPGERRKKNTFFPVFEEPYTHWGEFVARKRSNADNYERLLRLAEDLSDNSPYQYIDEYDYYRRK